MKADDSLISGLRSGERRALAKAITLMESTRADQRCMAEDLLAKIMPWTGGALRIGVSGVPGVGKSTLVEAWGSLILAEGKRVAVLAIDPSSPLSGGSIMGDRTRMETLSSHPAAFIRPSPSGGTLGGVARRTRETILLCEAAGYDVIMVETVGVGQSEVMVASMVDVFLMLLLPHAGDELQGVKKGILELADVIAITKADGETSEAARRTQAEHQSVMRLVRAGGLVPQVLTVSAKLGTGVMELWQAIQTFAQIQVASGRQTTRRRRQVAEWFQSELGLLLRERLLQDQIFARRLAQAEVEVVEQRVPASIAAKRVVDEIFHAH